MFGYIVVNQPELKIKEFETYRSYYCGLCKALQKKSGKRGQCALSYDMTFLALLLVSLYEPTNEDLPLKCFLHPFRKNTIKSNKVLDYIADMTLLLTWYKCMDDYKDEKKISRVLYGKTIARQVKGIKKDYPRQEAAIVNSLNQLSELEKNHSEDIDQLSGCFGRLLEEIFVMEKDCWEGSLRKIGFYIGKFVYIIDAYDDLEKDKEKGCFNPFKNAEKKDNFDDWIHQILMMAAVEFAKEFEKLPTVKDVEILRNILYSGIWTRYEVVKNNRKKELEEENEKSI